MHYFVLKSHLSVARISEGILYWGSEIIYEVTIS